MPFSDEIFAGIDKLEPPSLEGRRRVRGITIDSEGSRHPEDAIWVRQYGRFTLIEVSVSDVSSVVPYGSAIDREARKRCFEWRDNGRLERMIPYELVERFLSLLPGIMRPTITTTLLLDTESLKILNVDIERTKLASEVGYTYFEAAGLISSDPSGKLAIWHSLAERLYEKRAVEDPILRQWPHRYRFGGEATPDELVRQETSARKLVAELTILVNTAVAGEMLKRGEPFLFYNNSLTSAGKAVKRGTVRSRIPSGVRLFGNSWYGIINAGAPGVNADAYCHFTVPTRRYVSFIAQIMAVAAFSRENSPCSVDDLISISQEINDATDRMYDSRRNLSFLRQIKADPEKAGGIIPGLNMKQLGFFIDHMLTTGFGDEAFVQLVAASFRRQKVYGGILSRILLSPTQRTDLNPLKDAALELVKAEHYATAAIEAAIRNGTPIEQDNFRIPGRNRFQYITRFRVQMNGDWLCGSSINQPRESRLEAAKAGAISFFKDCVDGRLISARDPPEEVEEKFRFNSAAREVASRGNAGMLIVEAYKRGLAIQTLFHAEHAHPERGAKLTISVAGDRQPLMTVHGTGPDARQAYENAVRRLREPDPAGLNA